MIFLVALIVTAVMLVVLWRVIGPDQVNLTGTTPQPRPRPGRRPAPVPPDDNPEFLRDLDRRARPED